MPRVVVIAEVEDLDKWEKGFRTHRDLFRQMAVSKMEFGTTEGNRIAFRGNHQSGCLHEGFQLASDGGRDGS